MEHDRVVGLGNGVNLVMSAEIKSIAVSRFEERLTNDSALQRAFQKNAETTLFIVACEKWELFLLSEIERVAEDLKNEPRKLKELEEALEKRHSLDVRAQGDAGVLIGLFDRNLGGQSANIGARNMILSICRATLTRAREKMED